MTDDGGPMMEDRGLMTDDGGPMTDNGGRRTEVFKRSNHCGLNMEGAL